MNGLVVMDKPAGVTSRAVVEEVKALLGVRKAGHSGTLDPMATGVLLVCLGEATKLVQFLSQEDKLYRATLLLGLRTDTLDTEGTVIERREPCLSRQEVEAALASLVGRRRQVPPRYSAVKFRGRPLYEWSRRGVEVEREPREIEVYSLAVEEIALPKVVFTVACSKGTYIRSLCAEAGEILGCGGCMAALRRLGSGRFDVGQALSLEGLGEEEKRRLLKAAVVPMRDLLPEIASLPAGEDLARRLRNGYQPEAGVLGGYHIPFLAAGDVVKFVSRTGFPVAIGEMLISAGDLAAADASRQAVRILRVFNE